MTALVLDSEAISALAGGPLQRREHVRAAVVTARRRSIPIVTSTAVLAELLHGRPRDAAVDAAMRREAVELRDVDRRVARAAGRLLGAAGLDSQHAVDAFVAATAVTRGGGVILTGDPDDLRRLAAPVPNIRVEAI